MHTCECHRLWNGTIWVQNMICPCASSVTLDKLLNLFVPYFSPQQYGDNNRTYCIRLLRALIFWIKHTEWCQLAMIFISYVIITCFLYLTINSWRSTSSQNSSLYSPKEILLLPIISLTFSQKEAQKPQARKALRGHLE